MKIEEIHGGIIDVWFKERILPNDGNSPPILYAIVRFMRVLNREN